MPTTNGKEQVFNFGIKNNDDRPADTSADFLVTQNTDGTQGKIDPDDLPFTKASILTVASSYASEEVKKTAQFVCDGVNDDVEIQAAINSLPAYGGEIKLTNGLFNISSTVVIDKAVTFSGQGTGIAGRDVGNMYGATEGITTIRAVADVDVLRVDSAFKIKGIKFSDFILQGFGKDVSNKVGMYIKTETDVMQIIGVNVLDCGVGLFSLHFDAASVINSSFQYNALGAFIDDSYHVNLTNCVFADNNGKASITVGGTTYNVQTGGLAVGGANTNISGSVFVRNDIGGTPYNSLSVLDAISLKIDNCVFNEEQGNAIGIIGVGASPASGFAESTQISNSTITAFGKALSAGKRNGIYILKGHANHIFGNYIGSGIGFTTGEYAVYEDRAVNTYTGVTIVKNNIFRDIQNPAKVALTGLQSNYTRNINVGEADTDNQNYTGIETRTNTGSTLINGIVLTQSGTNTDGVFRILNTTTGVGELNVNSSTGTGRRTNNTSTGTGELVANFGGGIGRNTFNSGSGIGTSGDNQSTGVLNEWNSTTASTGDLLRVRKNGTLTMSINNTGNRTLMPLPPTSAGGFDILTRNTTTGAEEKVSSNTFAVNRLVFRGLISQSGTSTPTLTVLENNTGLTITAARNGVGQYSIVPSVGTFDFSKTYYHLENNIDNTDNTIVLRIRQNDSGGLTSGSLKINTTATVSGVTTSYDDLLVKTPIEIIIYP